MRVLPEGYFIKFKESDLAQSRHSVMKTSDYFDVGLSL
jgi:hypothetical protein